MEVNWQETIGKIVNTATKRVVTLDVNGKTVHYSDDITKHMDIVAIRGDEEITRAFLLNRLVNELNYDIKSIEIEKQYDYKTIGRKKAGTEGRIDVILKDSEGNPFFFIEVKEPNKFEQDKDEIEGQLFNLAEEEQKKYKTKVKYLVYYTVDTEDNKIKDRAIIIDYSKYNTYESWKEELFPSISDELSPNYNKPQKPPLKKGDKKYDLKSTFNQEEITALSKNLHSVLWGGGSTTDTEIFYSLVNILLAKIQDENERKTGEEYKFQIYQYGDTEENSDDVFERINQLYRRALKQKLNINDESKINKAYVVNEEKFPRNKLLYTVRAFEKYSLLIGKSSLDGRDILGSFFESITREGFKQTKGQFFTPNPIVKFLFYGLKVDELAIQKLNDEQTLPYIIDPSCGSGTFLIEAMRILSREVKYKQFNKLGDSNQVRRAFSNFFKPDEDENKWADEYLYGIEYNFDLGIAAKVNMILHGDGSTNIFVEDGLLPFDFYKSDKRNNVLSSSKEDPLYEKKKINGEFDVIVSNPPFSVKLESTTKNHLSNSYLFGNKKNSENLFIERWYQLLKPKGRLAAVLPESIFDTAENLYIRMFIYKYFNVKAVVSIPQLAFEPYTSTKTSLLFAQKKADEQIKNWNDSWKKYGKEWSALKTKVENYIKVYIDGENKTRFPSIKDDTDEQAKQNIIRFLKDVVEDSDKTLPITELLVKYDEHIIEISKVENSLKVMLNHYNLNWVFNEVANELDYKVFMAETENIGYKRTKKTEKTTINELFDIEIAPNYISKDEILDKYDETINEYQKMSESLAKEKDELEEIEKKRTSKTRQARITDIENFLVEIEVKIDKFQIEKSEVEDIIDLYYEEDGTLKDEYMDRLNCQELLHHFNEGYLKKYKSYDVLLRKTAKEKVLDYLREEVNWK